MIDSLLQQLAANQFLSGGVVIGVVGMLLAAFRKVPAELWRRLQGQLLVTIDVVGTDPLFEWVRVWLGAHASTQRSRLLTAAVSRRGGSEDGQVSFAPAPGAHFLRFRGHLVWVTRVREGIESSQFLWRELFTIRVLGRDPSVARALLEEARDHFLHPPDERTTIFRSVWDRWLEADRVTPRPLDSLILDDEHALTKVAADCDWFLAASDWYRARGIPYRRGYLFEGVPGSGKSSAIVALAGHCHRNIYLLSLSSMGMSDNRLQDLLFQVPHQGIVVLEDIDAAFVDRTRSDNSDRVTFSGVLNALDGIGAREGRLLFMTTNHADRIDPALIRAGRIDVRLAFGYATPPQVRRLYARFCPDATRSDAERFATGFNGCSSMADVQERLLALTRGTMTSGARHA